MAEISHRCGGVFAAWVLKGAGTTQATVYNELAVPIRYSLADPLATVPPDDLIPPRTVAHVVADPATYVGLATPGYFDSAAQRWLLITYAGANVPLVIPDALQSEIGDRLQQPHKVLPGPPPVTIPAPYGEDEKQYCVLQIIETWGVIDREPQT